MKKLSKFEKFFNDLCFKEDLFYLCIYDIINKESFQDPIFINICREIGKPDKAYKIFNRIY